MKLPNIKILIILLLLIFLTALPGFSITIPQDLDYGKSYDILLDWGNFWEYHTLTGLASPFYKINNTPSDTTLKSNQLSAHNNYLAKRLFAYNSEALSARQQSEHGLSLHLLTGISITSQLSAKRTIKDPIFVPFVYLDSWFKTNFYARVYARFTNNPEGIPHYTGVRRDIDRAGLRTGEFDQANIGFKSKYVNIELGRGREIWGANTKDNLLLSGNAAAYDRIAFQLDYSKWTYRWFYGYLESKTDSTLLIHRYLAGKILQFRPKSNLLLSVSEVSILTGPDRQWELAFFNPLTIHVEQEQNKRVAQASNQMDAAWLLNFDWMPTTRWRLSGEALLDEYQIDKEDRDEGNMNALGWMLRTAYSFPALNGISTLYASMVQIGTHAYQHGYRWSNWVSRSIPLGHSQSNDSESIFGGIRYIHNKYFTILLESGLRRWGDDAITITKSPYTKYTTTKKVDFPSGEVRSNNYFRTDLDVQPIKQLNFNFTGQWNLSHEGTNSDLENWQITLSYQTEITKFWRSNDD